VTALRKLHLGLLLPAAFAGAGCGGEGDGSPTGPIEGEEEIAAAWCETLVRCDLYPDVAACLASIDVVGDDLRAAFEAGHVSYDAGAAAACRAMLAGIACEELSGAQDLTACAAWDGTVPDGGECASGAECQSGGCDPGACDPALSCCTGSCAAPELDEGVPVGADCTIDACAADAYCDLDAAPPTCRALIALDQPCIEGECAVDLYCRITEPTSGTGVCSALPAEGEECDPAYPVCARGDNWCDPADSTCHELSTVGEACDEVSDNCVPYAWCSPEGRCAALPGAGEPCEDWPPCLGDLECVDDTCAAAPPDDEEGCADG
jgi:hypothetical protein